MLSSNHWTNHSSTIECAGAGGTLLIMTGAWTKARTDTHTPAPSKGDMLNPGPWKRLTSSSLTNLEKAFNVLEIQMHQLGNHND